MSQTHRPLSSFSTLLTGLYTAVIGSLSSLSLPTLRQRPTLPCIISGNVKMDALYDTGAMLSLMSEKAFRSIPVDSRPVRCSAPPLKLSTCEENSNLQVKGCFEFPITVLGRSLVHRFYVIVGLSSEVILGVDFIDNHGMSYDAITKTPYFDERKCWENASILAHQSTILKANSSSCVRVKAFSAPGCPVVGRPTACISEVTCSQLPVLGEDGLINIDQDGLSSIILDNPMDVDVEFRRGTFLGSVSKVDVSTCSEVKLDLSAPPLTSAPSSSIPEPEKAAYLRDAVLKKMTHLPDHIKDDYVSLILRNHDVFSRDKHDLGRTHVMEHSVTLKDDEPVYRKQFRIPHSHRSVLVDHLNNWLRLKVVSPSKSTYNSPIFVSQRNVGVCALSLIFGL